MKTNTHSFIIPRSVLLRMRNVTDEIVETIRTHLLFSIYFLTIVPFKRYCKKKKYCTAGQATDDNTARAHCILDT
jgi:hypothetical protein